MNTGTLDKTKLGACSLGKSFRSIVSNPVMTFGAMALDSVLLFMIGAILEHFGKKFIDTLLAIGTLMIPQSAASPETFSASLIGGPAQGLEARAIVLLALMASGAFCAFCIFEGSSYWIAYRSAGKKIGFLRFIALFTRVSFAFLPLFIAYESLGYLHDFNTLAAERMPGLGYWDPSYLVPIIGISAAYLILMSLSRLGEGDARAAIASGIRKGIFQLHKTIPLISSMILLVVLVESISRIALNMGAYSKGAALILFLFTLTLIKTSMITSLDHDPGDEPRTEETDETC